MTQTQAIHKIQESPNAVQIEPTEGCQLACSFCGMQGIRNNGANGPKKMSGKNSKPFKFMTTQTARAIASGIAEVGWNPRIEIAMHGEPTMNPRIHRIVSIFRQHLPKASIMMTSNGGGLLSDLGATENINNLMDNGLNVLLLDDYDAYNIVKVIKNKYRGPHDIFYYPENKNANPHRRRRPNEHFIVITEDVSNQPGGTHGKLMNHCACAFPRNNSMAGKRCARPFREMSIRWNGNVALCCMDWRGIYKCGNILSTPIDKIWNNKFFYAARTMLYQGKRNFGTCHGCDTRSYRVGLLPDKKGKLTLPNPNNSTLKAISEAVKGKPYTKPVWRPWEIEEKIGGRNEL